MPALSTIGEITWAFSKIAKPTPVCKNHSIIYSKNFNHQIDYVYYYSPCQNDKKITDLMVQNFNTGSNGVSKSRVAK